MPAITTSPFLEEITPDDAVVYDPPLMGIRVANGGNVSVESNGAVVPVAGLGDGEVLYGSMSKVRATGTTATSIIGWRFA